MEKSPAQIDTLLEPLLLESGDERADELLSQLIHEHAGPVIKGVIRYKLHLNSHRATQWAEADDLYQEALLRAASAVLHSSPRRVWRPCANWPTRWR